MRIPEEIIDQVRSHSDIVDVVSAHVNLKKRGKNLIGLCPFHTEKTPSFTVSPDKQMYHCFGCRKGGNVFTFIMETERVSFAEAVRTLAEKVGIQVSLDEDGIESSEIEKLYEVYRFAGKTFHMNLMESEEGRSVVEYFLGRGITEETIREFGLGYSLDRWDGFLEKALSEGFERELLLKAGLIRKSDDGRYYDYFRGRGMFPVFSAAGRVVAFGARKLKAEDSGGKYINSPETPIYSKSRILFGLFQAKEAIRDEEKVILVEGYADFLSIFQAGFHNVVASSGTALTREQVQLIKRYAKRILFLFDADSAGASAALRGTDVALEENMEVEIVSLPTGKDPDLYIREYGAEAFRELLNQSVSFIDFMAFQHLHGVNSESPERKTEAVRAIVQTIAKIKDELKRNFYIKYVSEKYNLYESVLHRELERYIASDFKAKSRPSKVASPVQPSTQNVNRESAENIPAPDREILKLLLEGNAEIANYLQSNISLDELEHERIRSVVDMIFSRFEEQGICDVSTLLDEFEDESLKNLVAESAFGGYELSKSWYEIDARLNNPDPWSVARGAVLALKKRRIQREIELNQSHLKEASQHGEELVSFVERHQELINAMKKLEQLYVEETEEKRKIDTELEEQQDST